MSEKKEVLKAFLTYYIELPFHLALPTGHYALHIPSQIKLHRDLYYLQKGNEIENVSSMVHRIEPQGRLFSERGLCSDQFSEYSYKRKLKTVLYRRYSINYTLIDLTEEEFYIKISSGQFVVKNLNIPVDMINDLQRKFMGEINEFLKYYVLFFPENHIDNLNQHEIRPLSNYEFSNCDLRCLFTYKEYGIPLQKIVLDFHDQTGIPNITYYNQEKFEEFENLIQNRANIKVLPYQELFYLARSLYRTNKDTMTSTIIVNAMTSMEGILNLLELIEPFFQNLRIKREKKKKRILYYYTDYYKNGLKSFLKNNYNLKFTNIDNSINLFNFGRIIRNSIIHETILDYNSSTDEISFLYKNRSKTTTLKELWQNLLLLYDILNKHILKIKYSSINWELESSYKKSIIGKALEDSYKGIVPLAVNYDWRETYSYKYDLSEFGIPPERIARGLRTSDGRLYNLNFDPNNIKWEFWNMVKVNDEEALIECTYYDIEKTYDQLIEDIEHKEFSIEILGKSGEIIEYYFSCPNCGNFCPFYHLTLYNTSKCPKCKGNLALLIK